MINEWRLRLLFKPNSLLSRVWGTVKWKYMLTKGSCQSDHDDTKHFQLEYFEGYEHLACQVQNNLSWLETSYLSNLTPTWNIGNIDDKLMINWKSPDQGPWLWFYCKLNIRRGGQEHTVSRGKINQSNCNVFTTNSFIFLDKASETENCVSFV